jgi:XPB/Ssl2-like helicase family protein
MPDLLHALPHNDLGFLRIAAGLWGLELTAPEPAEAAAELAELLADAELIEEMLASLPADARAALEALAEEGGRILWANYTRRFGDVREMGAGRRDREQPHLNPRSPLETLFYRALLARAFFETPSGPQEFAYIPDEFLLFVQPGGAELIEATKEEESGAVKPAVAAVKAAPLGRAASPGEKAFVIAASDRILDDATTMLAALRMGNEPGELTIPAEVLRAFLATATLIEAGSEKKQTSLVPGTVKSFLEAPRGEALSLLAETWQASESFDELRELPDLVLEGEVNNQPLVTRDFLLNLLDAIPAGQWWSLAAFIRAVKAQYPDFQRPAGNFDVWLVRRESDGRSLRGFANWDAVDGALIRYLITGPLFWLGQGELASAEEFGVETAFRLAAIVPKEENGKMMVASNGLITVERLAPRAARYQVARFCEWEESKSDDYRYRVTVRSLKAAAEQGLKPAHLLSLLAKHSGGQVPPAFIKALKRWEAEGTEARLEQLTVLRVSKPEVLAELKASPAARFLAEQLGPTAVIVKGGAGPKVLAALAELGLLAEVVDQ